MNTKYRSEIDGLRALAVVPVILFHAGIESFSGGFIGVDVFFVISGYLITTLIINEMDRGAFSLASFYERRARRILPALFFVMLVCMPFAWMWLTPLYLKDFAQSLVAVSTFSSNILFWSETGYFDVAAELKPLLHTWSLAVEEQYYILFPLFLMLTWRVGKRWVLTLLVLVFLLSLGLAQWGASHWHSRVISGAFFLLPARGWELLVGAFVAFYLQRKEVTSSITVKQISSLIGLVLIIFAIFAYDSQAPFPNLYVFLAAVGTALIILFAVSETWVNRLLSAKVLVGIGLISYSAYLWHLPLFAFTRNRSITEPSEYVMLALCVLTFPLAYFSWRFVERPFRSRSNIDKKYVFFGSLSLIIIFISVGTFGYFKDGFVNRLTESQRQILAFESYTRGQVYREGFCFLKPEQSYDDFAFYCASDNHALLWGDSHAAALFYGINQITKVSQYTASSCPPLIGISRSIGPFCTGINDFVLKFIESNQPSTVFLHASWASYNDDDVYNGLTNTINAVKKVSPSSRLIVVGGLPNWGQNGLPNRLLKVIKEGEKPYAGNVSVRADVDKVRVADGVIQSALNSVAREVMFMSILDKVCVGNVCVALVGGNLDAVPTAWDYGHLTKEGSVYVANSVFGHFYGTDEGVE
ncbi:acyltransferase [Dehalococcoidia bacterium]|nr:acyltransferase [Dehalococcoidia bacterium]